MMHMNFDALLVAVLLGLAGGAVAADTDYSGKYVAEQSKKAQNGPAESTLQVLQKENAIEVTLIQSAKRTMSRCPLDGSEGGYTSPGGVLGKCKAQLKGKTLIIESVVITHPQPTANVRVHTKEHWQLSRDGKTLTVRSDVDFPDFPPGISAAVSGDTSGTSRWTRVEGP